MFSEVGCLCLARIPCSGNHFVIYGAIVFDYVLIDEFAGQLSARLPDVNLVSEAIVYFSFA